MAALKVLVVDDHAGFRKSLASFLRSQRNVKLVGEATDGCSALQQAGRLKPDLIIIDAEMPGRDGYDTARELKQQLAGVRVVVLSMHSDESYRNKALQYALDGFIEKRSMKRSLLSLLLVEQARMTSLAIDMKAA